MPLIPKKLTGDLAQASYGTPGGDTIIIGLMEWSIDVKIKMVDGTTTDGLGSEFSLPSTVGWSATASFAFIDADPTQQAAILGALQLQSGTVNWNFYPTQALGRAIFSGPAFIDSLKIKGGGPGKLVGSDISLKGNGFLTQGAQGAPVGAPAITTQPAAADVVHPAPATFTVVASGNAPLNYQWSVGGVIILGATSASYTTPPTTIAMSGESFTCTIFNSLGSVTTTAAVLTVT
jgi:hypothetical protein